jgi:hypothetical protein
MDVACANCGGAKFKLHIAQTPHRVPTVYQHTRKKTARWTLLDFVCADCGSEFRGT